MMNGMGPPAPMAPGMGPPPPQAGASGMDKTMYEMRLAQIKQMPPGPEQDAAIAALSADYAGMQSAAEDQQAFGAKAALMGSPDAIQTGGKYGTTVAANPLEHMAAGLRTYKGYKDMGDAQESMSDMSMQKQQALRDLLKAGL